MILTRDLPKNPALRRFGRQPATLGETLSAVAEDPTLRPTELAAEQQEIEEERIPAPKRGLGAFLDPIGARAIEEEREARAADRVDPETLNDEFGHLGLTFDKPMPRAVAKVMAEDKRAEIIRQDVIARGPQGFGAGVLKFGTAVAGAAIDPVNIAAGFLPVAREARLAGFLARFSKTGRRVAEGVIEGAAGNALVELPVYGLARAQQRDYEMADALVNVLAGGVIGAGGRVVSGAIQDRIARLSPEARQDASSTAVAQAVQGKSVSVEPVMGDFRRDLLGSTTLSRRADIDPAQRAPDDRVQIRVDDQTIQADLSLEQKSGIDLDDPAEFAGTDGAPSIAPDDPVLFASRERIFDEAAQKEVDAFSVRSAGLPRSLRGKGLAVEAYERAIRAAHDRGAAFASDVNVSSDAAHVWDALRRRGYDVRETGADQQLYIPPPSRPRDVFGRRFETPEARKRLVEGEQAPQRDLTANFEAARKATETVEKAPADFDSESAQVEADFAAETVADLRRSGLLTDAQAREVDAMDDLVSKAESFGRGAREAALCLTRRA